MRIIKFFRGIISWLETGYFITETSNWLDDVSHIVNEDEGRK
jgi:hypothetical protein